MSAEPKNTQVKIIDRKSGERRLSQPKRPRQKDSTEKNKANLPQENRQNVSPLESESSAPVSSFIGETVGERKPAELEGARTGEQGAEISSKSKDDRMAKIEIQTLEQFVDYAYRRKGQRVYLKAKTERLIARNSQLEDEAKSRLLSLAAEDVLLAVPRQLLLVSREIQWYPALRGSLQSFLSEVMLRHPIFASSDLQATLRNVPEGLPMSQAIAVVVRYEPAEAIDKYSYKPAELKALRINAANLLATWFASNRGLDYRDLASLLFEMLWEPAARNLADDNARLRALTEVEQFESVGLASHRFQQQAVESRKAEVEALSQLETLRQEKSDVVAELESVQAELTKRCLEFETLEKESGKKIAELIAAHEAELMHVRHSVEQLRGRLVRRLSDSLEMLEVGMTALRNRTPRTEVMLERAELVVDALREELNTLLGGKDE